MRSDESIQRGDVRDVLFEIHAVTCRNIRTTRDYWRYIVEVKHPESFKKIAHKAAELVMETLKRPDIVVRAKLDPRVYLYYRRFGAYFICVVAKHLNGDGYIVTSYRTDRLKKGEIIWQRQ